MNPAEQLKEATRQAHEETEDQSFADNIRRQSLSPEQYHRLLRINYQFHDTVGKSLQQWFAGRLEYMLDKRIRVKDIQDDLTALGLEIPVERPKFKISSYPEALGALYVLEGSTLGGRIILKAVLGTDGVKEAGAFKFYDGYGGDTGKMWKEFISLLNAESFSDAEIQATIQGALKTFALYKELAARK